jgi:geranylgeranyl diphosphate synthase type II
MIPVEPQSLYAPVRHIVSAGGKRVRPILTALSSRIAQGTAGSETTSDPLSWLHSAVAIELLHTFTLVHDDIMDNAATRRNLPTAHVEFGMSSAILAGDVLIPLAIDALCRTRSSFLPQMVEEFAMGFRLVCDGQALDKEYETRDDISVQEYLHMIDLKTSKIIELAAVLGAYAGGGEHVESLRRFAHHAGLAFQINDDLLDLTAHEAAFGKLIGGDILEGKRTYLFVSAMSQYDTLASEDRELMDMIGRREASVTDILRARDLFERIGVLAAATAEAQNQTHLAQDTLLGSIPESSARNELWAFSESLLRRSS